MPNPCTWYANYYFTVNNEGRVGIFVSVTNRRMDRQTDGPTFFWNSLVILIPMVYNTPWLLEKKTTVSMTVCLHSRL